MSTALQRFNLVPIGNTESYIQMVNRIPLLDATTETDLATRYHQASDLEAARQLIMSQLRFVVRIAKGYMGYGLALADLIQEGNVGLMKAVKRFDPLVGVRLITYAVHWIKAEIHEFILRNWRIVKVATTKEQRKLFFNIRSAKKELGNLNQAQIDEVALNLGVNSAMVREMESRMGSNDSHFDAYTDDEDEGRTAPSQYLEDHRYNPATQFEQQQTTQLGEKHLHAALASLDERSHDILNRRWLADEKATLHELANHYQVSAERIRQIEQNAMKKLKAALAD